MRSPSLASRVTASTKSGATANLEFSNFQSTGILGWLSNWLCVQIDQGSLWSLKKPNSVIGSSSFFFQKFMLAQWPDLSKRYHFPVGFVLTEQIFKIYEIWWFSASVINQAIRCENFWEIAVKNFYFFPEFKKEFNHFEAYKVKKWIS